MVHDEQNLGTHIARRLVEIGCDAFFSVPGDFNLLLLDQLLKEPKLRGIWCCNELNAGYAADGYARCQGIGCAVVTFTVGGLSIINAIAGAYAEDLPIILISSGPNTNDFATDHVLHHTTGDPDFQQELRCFSEVTCHQCVISHVGEAHRQIDTAITECIKAKKPVYIQVSCNLSAMQHPSFASEHQSPYVITPRLSNPEALEAAVREAAMHLNKAVKPILLAGARLRRGHRRDAFLKLAHTSRYPVAIQPTAKGLVPETHPGFMGLYWGCVSSPVVGEVVESSDLIVSVGTDWTDYTTVGYSLLIKPEEMIEVFSDHVVVCSGKHFGCVRMDDFLEALAEAVTPNDAGHANFSRMHVPPAAPPEQQEGEPLVGKVLYKHIQAFLKPEHCVFAEVGDSWFNTQKLRLPDGCGYEAQLRYGSVGWGVGATLGYQIAAGEAKRVMACIGDGGFQFVAQEISTILRYGLNPIVLLINNGGHTIDVEIHDGPYNVIKNWDYMALVESLHNGDGKLWTANVKTEQELLAALDGATAHSDSLVFIEVLLPSKDCSKELLVWGSRVAKANHRPPRPS